VTIDITGFSAVTLLHFPRLCAALLAIVGLSSSHPNPRPFSTGERAEYDVRYGVIRAGTGTLSVVGIDTIRGRDAYRFRMTLSAGVNLLLYRYSVRDTMESWVDTATFQSLRFTQDQFDGGRRRTKRYQIFPERQTYIDGDEPEQSSVADPLDDISLLYYVRASHLEVGTTTEIPRHFKPKSNPVILKVLKKDTIEAAGKKWPTIVVQPIIKTSTMFSDGGEARVWLSDDSAHVIVQINTKVSVGSITMTLRSYQPSGAARQHSAASGAPPNRGERSILYPRVLESLVER
jgi:hypothetical protein